MNNTLSTGVYHLHCQFLDDAVVPSYKGSTFRGAFGSALKRVVCAVRKDDCQTCLLKGRCVYARIFEVKEMPTDGQQRIVAPPHPYVIEPPLTTQKHMNAGECFSFKLVLFGEANEWLPYFIYAFENMGEQGLGKHINARRARFALTGVEVEDGYQIYEARERTLVSKEPVMLSLATTIREDAHGHLTIRFMTPLRLKFENQLQAELPFQLLVRAMLRRISSLFEFYGTGEPDLDYRGLVFRAKEVSMTRSTLHWFEWERYSARQDQKMLMGGIAGSVTYDNVPPEYFPLVELCRTLHIGKQSSFGLGQFAYQWETA